MAMCTTATIITTTTTIITECSSGAPVAHVSIERRANFQLP